MLSQDVIAIVVFVICVVALAVVAFLVGGRSSPQRRMSSRMQRVATAAAAARGGPDLAELRDVNLRKGEGRTAESFDKVMGDRVSISQLKQSLLKANVNLSVTEFILISVVLAVVVGLIFGLLVKLNLIYSIAAGVAVGFVVPRLWLKMRFSRRNKRFLKLFPDALDLITRAIKAGIPVTEAVVSVGQEVADPVGEEFRIVADKIKIGVLLEEALFEAVDRIGIEDFRFFVVTLNIQRDTGGNLAETLENLADIIRKRQELRLKVRALSSEARASAYILGALPFVTALILVYLNPGYISKLIEDPFGHTLIGIGVTMLALGFFTMWRMINFEI